MDVIFAYAYNHGLSPVAVSLRKDIPQAGTPEADRILFPDDERDVETHIRAQGHVKEQ